VSAYIVFFAVLAASVVLAAPKPNVVVIVVDDQGYGDLSAYEHAAKDVRTPQMDRLAKSGVLFTQAYSAAPICSAARAGWMTGRNPARWDAKAFFNCGLPDPKTPTIAELMKAKGYATARIGKSDYSNAGIHKQRGREYPLNHGYDEFLGFCAHGFDFFLLSQDIYDRTPDPRSHSASVGPLMHNRGTKAYKEGYLTEIFTDAAIDFLERNQEKPFFLTLSYNAVHHLVHQSPKRYLDKYGVKEIPNYDPDKDGKYGTWFKKHITLGKITDAEMRKYYLANLNCLDDNIGRFLDAMDRLKLRDNTMIVYFSDNGGPPTNGAWNLPLAGSKFTLWEGGIRVPFILSRPKDPNAGKTWTQPTSALDVYPTILDAVGIQIPDGLDGQVIGKAESQAKRNLYWNLNSSYALRSGDWKLLNNATFSGRKPTSGVVYRPAYAKGTRLFNLNDDPGESKDLSQSHPEVEQQLQKLYAEWSKTTVGTIKRKK
jgi:arylsulfatase A-like enzyme